MSMTAPWRTIIGSSIDERDDHCTVFEVEEIGFVRVYDRDHEKAIDFGLNPTATLDVVTDTTREDGEVLYKIVSFEE